MGSADPAPRRLAIAQIARRVAAAPPRLGTTRLVCIDGPAGAGKTSLAEPLQRELSNLLSEHVPVVHLDDLYNGWEHAFDDLAERLMDQVFTPLSNNRAGRYQRFDWAAGRFAEEHAVPVRSALVVEGVGAAPLVADPYLSLLVWVDAPAALRLARGVRRDGTALRAEWERWLVREQEHFQRERTRERAHLIVDGAATQAPGPHLSGCVVLGEAVGR